MWPSDPWVSETVADLGPLSSGQQPSPVGRGAGLSALVPGWGLLLTWAPGLWLRGHEVSMRTVRFSVGAALRASAVERKLSSSVSCRPFFLSGPSHCTGGLRLGAMADWGHQGGLQVSMALHPTWLVQHQPAPPWVCPLVSCCQLLPPTPPQAWRHPSPLPPFYIPSPSPQPVLCAPDMPCHWSRGQARALSSVPTSVKEEPLPPLSGSPVCPGGRESERQVFPPTMGSSSLQSNPGLCLLLPLLSCLGLAWVLG